MAVFAACAASFRESVEKAAGVEPMLSPPLSIETFDAELWSGFGFYYFKLHGLPGQPYWYGDAWTTACSAAQLSEVDMSGAVVFVAGCNLYRAGTEPAGPILDALFDAGARAVVGGAGVNWGTRRGVVGADALGINVRRLVTMGAPVGLAFRVAMERLKRKRPDKMEVREEMAWRDALEFRLLEVGDVL